MIISFDIEGSEEFKEAVRDFIEFRKEKKKPLTARGFELFMRKLEKLAEDEDMKIKIIEQSIENSWTGVFPLHFDAEEPVRAKVKPSGFNNFTNNRKLTEEDIKAIKQMKRESLMKKVGNISDC